MPHAEAVTEVRLPAIPIGATTTLDEELITGEAYQPAPSPELVAASVAIFMPQLLAHGIDPFDVEHVVLGDPFNNGCKEAYVSTDISPDENGDFGRVSYTRIL